MSCPTTVEPESITTPILLPQPKIGSDMPEFDIPVIEGVAIFVENEKAKDPVMAVKIKGHWFSLFNWE